MSNEPKARDTRVFAERVNFGRHVAIDIVGVDVHGEVVQFAKPIEFENVTAEEAMSRTRTAALLVQQSVAQQLIDALWDAGLRPTQGQQSHGQFAAQGRHLEDMRAMVKVLAKVELP